ncbi:c-type cytochrome [Pyxidicoccus xibeiensis]|uniref:c-type cytochrome n=1 Tax=Pyxidicoccus xibeiensis TaxID=2906759 RepID=UPI0020A82876|nr:c-type cytochrome [Pyxidicoccus xibeiensis]MCP3138231.1 c-type cytochrome [Pyxidicoccus xibeiensis]
MRGLLRSRGAFLLFAALLWLGLDAGRSWNGHRAYRAPASTWHHAPSAALAWPPGVDLTPDVPLGRRVFVQRCAVCHGQDGRGGGPAASSMRPRPPDLTTGELKVRSTPAEAPASTEDLTRTVRDGLANSAMPSFRDVLTDEELRAVVRYVQELSGTAAVPPAAKLEVPPPPSFTPEVVERGRATYARLQCGVCHGADGGLRRRFDGADGQVVIAPDLRQPWTFKGGREPEQVWLRLSTGMLPGPMPSYADASTPAERWDVVAWLDSIALPAPWEPGGRLRGLGTEPDLLLRGDYLSRAQLCQLCHTSMSPTGVYNTDALRLAGGMRIDAYPHGTQVSRNLTDVRYRSEDELMAIIREGRMPDRQLSIWAMTWSLFNAMTDDDARALARYLRSLTPVRREIPDVVHYGVLEMLVRKVFLGLPGAFPNRLVYGEGDASGLPSAAPVERALSWAQWLIGGLALLRFLVPLRGERRDARAWAMTLGTAAGAVGLVYGGWVAHQLPGLAGVAPEQAVEGTVGALPPVDPAKARTPEARAMAERGRYLFNIASCVMCHGERGEGGAMFSWTSFGTLYARNLTSHPEHGLGQWTDAELARAIRSGISRSGRPLHWQGMPWDMFSNLEEEDVRALIAYLRMLPPVALKVNAPQPPAPHDCGSYSVFLRPVNQPPGCHD